jgi:sporulation protein YlmC with PRC-barrel domain
MKCSIFFGSVVGMLSLGLAPLFAAEPGVTGAANVASPGEIGTSATKPAEACLSDLRAFHIQMQKDGYWLGASDDAYGYPIGGSGYTYEYPMGANPPLLVSRYPSARPGYEVRNLVASANILARQGQQQLCEDVLTTTRNIYSRYIADLHSGGAPKAEDASWRQDEIAAAQPVAGNQNSFRSDQLIGTDVRTPQNETLGSIDDLVMSPQAGKIAYLVIARGGIFGIDEKYVPVPWEDFKVTPKANLLVLDATKSAMNAAPQVGYDQFTTTEKFNQESQKVDAYWKTHIAAKGHD